MAVKLCATCDLPLNGASDHPSGLDCLEAQRKAMLELLNNVGTRGLCRGCSRPGYWVTHYNGKQTFYTAQGLNHFVDCPVGARFKR